MKTMKKLPFFVLALLFLMGCQAKPATDDTDSSDVSIVEWEHSDIYTDADIQAAMDTVMTYFETEFKGCTLTQLCYPGALEAKSDNVPPLFRRYVFVGKEVKL